MKKALLVISFDTGYHDTCEKNIATCERDLTTSCLDHGLFRAFISEMIIHKLKQRNDIEIDAPLRALQRLAEQGYQDVAIQSPHITNGDEYERIAREVQSMRPSSSYLALGVPLLSSHKDYAQLTLVLQQRMPALDESEKVVLMGRDAGHHALATCACLDHMMMAQYFPARVETVKSYPEVDVLTESLSQEGVTTVHLMPLMLVADDRAINDMASNEDDSWEMLFNATGTPAMP